MTGRMGYDKYYVYVIYYGDGNSYDLFRIIAILIGSMHYNYTNSF